MHPARRIVTLALALAFALVAAAASAQSARVAVDAALDHASLHANKRHLAYLRVALTGFEPPKRHQRAPLNVALVIDKSGSMGGEKIEQAKAAARAALDHLTNSDIVSVVAYDDTVQVLVPATRVSDRRAILAGIDRLHAGGSTALFAGTIKGAREVRKFLDDKTINRVVLLSDGQANVGPSSPGELGRLGRKLRKGGITVTTVGLGLGYNEDLMVELARRSGGNHEFVEHPRQLAKIFREGFGSLASIVARDVAIEITLEEGFRPVRILGRDGDILGQKVTTGFTQLYGGELDEVLLEVEISPTAPSSRAVAGLDVRYLNLISGDTDRLQRTVRATFTDRPDAVEASVNKATMVSVVEKLADERNRMAIKLRDEGRTAEAKEALDKNAAYLQQNAVKYDAPVLMEQQQQNLEDRDNLDERNWKRQRKQMKKRSYKKMQKGGKF